MNMNVGIVGFSFGLRDEEPNPSNIALAEVVADAIDFINFRDSAPIIVTQWEITKALDQMGIGVDRTVDMNLDGSYLDTKGLWETAKEEFAATGVTQVIIVAQPYLHLPSIRAMVEKDRDENGNKMFQLLDFPVLEIPFDNTLLNTQAWTRSKSALTIYAIKKAGTAVFDKIATIITGKKPERVRMQHDK